MSAARGHLSMCNKPWADVCCSTVVVTCTMQYCSCNLYNHCLVQQECKTKTYNHINIIKKVLITDRDFHRKTKGHFSSPHSQTAPFVKQDRAQYSQHKPYMATWNTLHHGMEVLLARSISTQLTLALIHFFSSLING